MREQPARWQPQMTLSGAIAAMLIASCVGVPTEQQPPSRFLVVHLILSTIADTQFAELAYSVPVAGESIAADPAEGAHLRLVVGDSIVPFVEIAPGRHQALLHPESGVSYRLEGADAEGAEFSGWVTVPAEPVITDPVEASVELPASQTHLNFSWQHTAQNTLQLVTVRALAENYEQTLSQLATGPTHSVRVEGACLIHCCGTVTVAIANPDSALLRRLLPPGRQMNNLVGARGMLGALAADTVQVRFSGAAPCAT